MYRLIMRVLGLLAASFVFFVSHPATADISYVIDCDDSIDSLTPMSDKTFSLGNSWELTADTLGWCRKTDDPDVDNIIVARGNVSIRQHGSAPILTVDFSAMHIDELKETVVTIQRDAKNNVQVVVPSYSGLGMQLIAPDIIRFKGSNTGTDITLISDYPWRFYPNQKTSNLVLYPAFFRPVLNGVSDGTFGWTGSIIDALENRFEEGSLNLPIPFTVTGNKITTVSGQEPVILFNIGSWFGKVFGMPLESVPVTLSQVAGESQARVKFDVSDVFGSISGKLLGVLSHLETLRSVFQKINSVDKVKLATKEAIVWGDKKIVKYCSPRLSPLLDDTRSGFLKDIEAGKSNKPADTNDLFKALGRFFAMAVNSELDYDFINQDVGFNPLYIQLGLFEAVGDFQGNIYAGLSKRGEPADYFIDTLGLDVTMPYELTQLSAIAFFGLEKALLVENPLQIGLGIVELGGTISGMADPLYDVFQLAGMGGEPVNYSQWHVESEMEGTVALVDSLELIMSTQSLGLPWLLTLKAAYDFRLGNQNGIEGTGTISIFDIIEGTGSFHFFIGDNSKPVDFQAGCNANVLGFDVNGTFSSYFDTHRTFWMTLVDKVSYTVDGHDLAGLPFEIDVSLNEDEATFSAGTHWSSSLCAFNHCLIHGRSITKTRTIHFHSQSESTTLETSYGDNIYTGGLITEHDFTVSGGNERLTISAQGNPGAYPLFTVTGPDGTGYHMHIADNDGGSLVIDMNSADLGIYPVSGNGSNITESQGFLVDADAGTTFFVLETPLPGSYTVTLVSANPASIEVGAHVTAGMVALTPADSAPQSVDIDDSAAENLTVAIRSANTHTGSKIAIYARPTTVRNSTYGNWHEKLFSASTDPSIRSFISDEGDYDYLSDWKLDGSVKTLGYLETACHSLGSVVAPRSNLIQLYPAMTRDDTNTLHRNKTSIRLGEFTLNSDGVHTLDIPVAAHALYNGKYQLLAKFEDRNDADYVELPWTVTVHGDTLLEPATVTSVTETDDGEARITWSSPVKTADIAMVRVYLHDYARGSTDEVYHTSFDVSPTDTIKIPGLEKDADYGFSIALLKSVTTTDASGKTHTVNLPGLRSDVVRFTPHDSSFTGSPCMKLIDSESFAQFEANGDLFIRMRLFNESGTDMPQTPVRIYYNHRKAEDLLAEFYADQKGQSFSDIHVTIPFDHISALNRTSGPAVSIVYDIDTQGLNEYLTSDNAGTMAIKNVAAFLALNSARQGTAILLHLKKGWNLVGDGVAEDDVFNKLTNGMIYSHDGSAMKTNVPNAARGGGYFVYLPKDTNIVLSGTPVVPDFSQVEADSKQLMGTGVDIYNTLVSSQTIPSGGRTYTPGVTCDRILVLESVGGGDTRWVMNPPVIKAGSGFWCVKEL